MTLPAGTKLGPYEILGRIGAGGMGEVWKARDTRLGREVAVKVLPASFSADPERVKRFEQEAQSASHLNHPNILVVHDVGSHEGSAYIVSELLEGESLREKLGTPMPPRKAVEYAMQVAHGLAAAHEKGIVHRDLKPENLFVTKDGRIKILDFGIAKLTQRSIGSGAATEAPTAVPDTEPGVLIGTVPYMSPEQVQGKPLDARSDLFSLGTVLYEMLSGKRPFQKDTAAETMTAILREEPPELSQTNTAVSPGLEKVARHCLEKEPSSRFQSARDVAFALETLSTTSIPASATGARTSEAPHLRRHFPVWVIIVIAVLLATIVIRPFRRRGSSGPPTLSLSLSFPLDAAPDTYNTNPLALSPDGKTLVYAGLRGGQRKLFVRSLDREEIKEIPETEGASKPFFSPDALWVGFFADKKLKKVALAGGSPIALCDAPINRGASWGADNTIVFVPGLFSGLQGIPSAGGEPKAVTVADAAKAESHYFPQVLPDGENVLFEIRYFDRPSRGAVVSLKTGERRMILENAVCPRYLPSGHLVFARAGLLYAAPFSLKRLQVTGPAVPLQQNVYTNRVGAGNAEFAYSQEGTLVYVPYQPLQRTLVWVDRKGAVEQTSFPPGGYRYVALSPDGGRLAAISLERAEAESLLVGDLTRGTLTRSNAEGMFAALAWTPDGRKIAFAHYPDGKHLWQVFWQSADGSTAPERLGPEIANKATNPSSFAPDGSALLIDSADYTLRSAQRLETVVLPLTGERTLRPLFPSRSSVSRGRFSPDSRWVAYESDESARPEIYAQPYPGPGARWQISIDGGRDPRWSHSGRELFYWQGSMLMAVDVETQPAFRAGRPRALFDGRAFNIGVERNNSYDVSPDGTRFLLIKPDPEESGPAHVKVVLNWFEDVKRRVPGGR